MKRTRRSIDKTIRQCAMLQFVYDRLGMPDEESASIKRRAAAVPPHLDTLNALRHLKP